MARSTSSMRFAFVDALRGIAALSVVLFHVYAKNLQPMTGFEFAQPLDWVLRRGYLGVHIFFVISGFVIAQSIRGQPITPRYVGWFALRRSLRLDPPYWATIAAMIVLTFISNHIQHERSLPIPSVGSVLAHLGYAQSFLGYAQIVPVFWTLCYEIQFYLVLVLATGLVQRARVPAARWLVFGPLWLLALGHVTGYVELPRALFTFAWPYFFLGVIVNWTRDRAAGPVALAAIWVSALVVFPTADAEITVAMLASIVLYAVSKADKLGVTLGRGLQYLGRISYSLYLTHMLVGTPLVRLGIRTLGTRPDLPRAIVLVVAAVAISILAAHLFHVMIERPAVRWSHRLRQFKEPARAIEVA
jgi:peptidoglycan/LPS O-acetylase OafA/YrhL